MALEESILNDVKKNLGLGADNDAFDHDVITQINSAFFTLNQLGIGPPDGFQIEDKDDKWEDFVTVLNKAAVNALKSYFFLKARVHFDPPGTPHHLAALKEQVTELEHRLSTERELVRWSAPSSLPSLP